MSIRMRQAFWQGLGELRYEPTEKRVRAVLGDITVVDTTGAVLFWEPRRVTPSYAVPAGDLRAELTPVEGRAADERPILDPRVPFAAHSTGGQSFDLVVGGRTLAAAAFVPDDAALEGHVVLDFDAFDTWLEEDEPLVGHPRDPYHRVDVRKSSRTVRIELDGRVLAESSSPSLVFETNLPTRFYLPHQDVQVQLGASELRTRCAYKGEARYWSVEGVEGGDDLVWEYESPLPDAAGLAGLVAFYDDRVTVIVDGVPRERARPF
jgi:uncharacterized protein (DUF427 family)